MVCVNNGIKGKLLESETLAKQAASNTKERFANSPDLTAEIMNAVMDAFAAHSAMSRQALDSEKVRSGLKDVLLGPAQLYEALRARGVESQLSARCVKPLWVRVRCRQKKGTQRTVAIGISEFTFGFAFLQQSIAAFRAKSLQASQETSLYSNSHPSRCRSICRSFPIIQDVGVDRLRRAVGTFWNVIVARWACKLLKMWWPETGSNRRRRPFQGRALPLSYLALA